MTSYKLNPEIGKITSPVEIVWNGMSGNSLENLRTTGKATHWNFNSGAEAIEHVFDKHFNVIDYKAVDNSVVITVYEFMEPSK